MTDLPNNMGNGDDGEGDEQGTTLPATPAARKAKTAKPKSILDDGAETPIVPPMDNAVKRIRIILEENDNIPPTGQFIGVNGRGYMLRPGEEAEVPMEVIGVLENAVMEIPQVNPQTRQVESFRKKLRFPFRVIAKDI